MVEINKSKLSFDNLALLPWWQKIAGFFLFGIGLLLFAYWAYFAGELTDLRALETRETELKEQYERLHYKTVSLTNDRNELLQLQQYFNKSINILPQKEEVSNLLDGIGKKGHFRGLEFKLFDPLDEIHKDFFVEIPIKILASGYYNQLAGFISDLTAMNQLVTVHDMSITPVDKTTKVISQKGQLISAEMLIKIYRYKEKQA